MDLFNVEGEWHKEFPNGSHRVKAKILHPDLAMYINGNIVFPPDKDHPEWTVYTPKAMNARIVEFAKSSKLWQEIQKACIEAVKIHLSHKEMDERNEMRQVEKDLDRFDKTYGKRAQEELDKVFDVDEDEPINLDHIDEIFFK